VNLKNKTFASNINQRDLQSNSIPTFVLNILTSPFSSSFNLVIYIIYVYLLYPLNITYTTQKINLSLQKILFLTGVTFGISGGFNPR